MSPAIAAFLGGYLGVMVALGAMHLEKGKYAERKGAALLLKFFWLVWLGIPAIYHLLFNARFKGVGLWEHFANLYEGIMGNLPDWSPIEMIGSILTDLFAGLLGIVPGWAVAVHMLSRDLFGFDFVEFFWG
ncbi:MAG: hypothetical protein HRU33_25245 [Rhodobacteraceae bacterium]|nr:hypothetical protein [Paracoccaceae bacterium]